MHVRDYDDKREIQLIRRCLHQREIKESEWWLTYINMKELIFWSNGYNLFLLKRNKFFVYLLFSLDLRPQILSLCPLLEEEITQLGVFPFSLICSRSNTLHLFRTIFSAIDHLESSCRDIQIEKLRHSIGRSFSNVLIITLPTGLEVILVEIRSTEYSMDPTTRESSQIWMDFKLWKLNQPTLLVGQVDCIGGAFKQS